QEGSQVAINYRRGLEGARATEETILDGGARHSPRLHQADISQEEEVDRMFDSLVAEMGGVDILINNAGF
ncbi:MAG: SDR family oxidoreductase, partial [Akkermansiaceae bacterium]|nr:SDR family oxidoreductase [Akkermansiaceae bacterium]